MDPLKARFSYARFSNRAAMALIDGDLVEIRSWTDVDTLTEDNPSWDGTVVFGQDFDEIAKAGPKADHPRAYMDENIVCGTTPKDMDWDQEEQLSNLVNSVSVIFKAPRWVKGSVLFTLAAAWREKNWVKMTDDELLSFATTIYPALGTVKAGPSGGLWSPWPTVRGLEVYRAAEDDAPEIAMLLTHRETPTSTTEALQLVRKGMLVVRNFEDRMVAASVIDNKRRVHSSKDNEKILSLVEDLVEQAKAGEYQNADNFCFAHKKSSLKCACPKDAKGFIQAALKGFAASGGGEHRWGDMYSTRPSVENLSEVGKLSAKVRQSMISDFTQKQVDVWEEKLGRAVWFDVAVFLQQCHQDEKVLKGIGESMMKELLAANGRVSTIHDYANTLFQEFEGNNRTIAGSFNEIYLGRDAIFAYHARQAQRTLMRERTPFDQRRDKFAELSKIEYVVVSRTAKWISGVHTPLLGENPSVFIDTGFSGSIPHAICQEEHLSILNKPSKIAKAHEIPHRGAQVRLMCTANNGYQFKHQWSHDAVNRIEMDAKPTKTAYAVNEAHPTGAIEQLVFRVLRRGISDFTRTATEKILASEPEMGPIRTYEDAQRFIAKSKAEMNA